MTTVIDLARGRQVTATSGISLQAGALAVSDNAQTLHADGSADLSFAGDFCVEWFGSVAAMPTSGHLISGYSLSGSGVTAAYALTFDPALNRVYGVLRGVLLENDFPFLGLAPRHVALDRAAGVARLFVDGALLASTQTGNEAASVVGPYGGTVDIGRSVYGYLGYSGTLGWCRLTNASRYTSNFVPAGPVSIADPLWSETVLLIVAGNVVKSGNDISPARERRGDIKTFFDLTAGADYGLESMLLATDDGLTTAVILSLFTDARARPDDRLPHSDSDRRGWWGDAWPMVPGESMGSRLWLAWPGKQTADNLARAREAAEDALRWLVDDGIARVVSVQASNPRDGVLALAVSIERPEGEALSLRFESLWS